MPLSIDTSISPYHDDWSVDKDYYKILFRPGVSVQARELNQMQTMLQNQVEKFGDNIFKRGTIIDGCDIGYHTNFPYVKILDVESDGSPVDVTIYEGYSVKNQANVAPLIASINTVIGGYESQAPDLNTLYVRYQNSGYSNIASVVTEQSAFAANQTLTIYDPTNVVEKAIVVDGSAGFANSDSVVIMSAIAVQNSTGGTTFANNFYVGDLITDSSATATIYGIDTTSNTQVVILKVKPRTADLHIANSSLWTFSVNTNIQSTNASPSSVANVVDIIGTGAKGSASTGTLGNITSLNIVSKGSGYYITPYATVSSKVASTGQIASLSLQVQGWLANVSVANSAVSPVGSGYAMTVGQGVVYQKGYFTRVAEDLVIVSKYTSIPDGLAVGFDTSESIVNSNQDESLLDNATGTPNFAAPGANRLKLTPTLVVKTKADADANTNFFSIAEFSQGQPYKQNRRTVYNIIGDEMSQRTYEESGNYVLDTFSLNTKSPTSFASEANTFDILIDPGKAYIEGNRVETEFNYETGVAKGLDTLIANSATISLNYGNYVRVNEAGGPFRFNTAGLVYFYTTAGHYISTGTLGVITSGSLGTNIGTGRIRSVTLESGIPGTASAVYRLYLFDINMNAGVNFASARSIYYDDTANKAVADIVLESGKAVIKDNNNSGLLYFAGNPAVKSVNNVSYIYKTYANNLTLGTNGVVTWAVSGGETFPYTGTLSNIQENDLIIVPLTNSQYSANAGGSLALVSGNSQVTGTSTTFTSVLEAGDFIKVANSSANVICQVNTIANDSVIFLKNAPGVSMTGNAVVYLPSNIPISLNRSTRTANVSGTLDTFTVNLGSNMNVSTTVCVSYNVRSSNTTPVSKTVNRDRYVRLYLANNATTTNGPWALGVTDVFRMKGVYKGGNNTFAPGDSGVVDVTGNFYIDHNQNEDYSGISYLYANPDNPVAVTGSNSLLVKFDHFTDSGVGLKAPGASGTYLINDTALLAASTSTINTMEIPEVFGNKGTYYDLRDQFDFRPQAANTVTTNTVAASAPINPAEPAIASKFSAVDKRYPAPDSSLTGTIEYYLGRVSRVTVDRSGNFVVMHGIPGSNTATAAPSDALTINLLNIPPYPSLPFQLSAEMIKFVDTKIANEKYTSKRLNTYRVTAPLDPIVQYDLQPRGYTMENIGTLERRIAALEYYTSFTLAELMTQKRSIPSSFDPTIDRYKFGFFVDSFDDYTYSDISNPAYKASVVNGDLVPYAQEMNLVAENANAHTMLPYVEMKMIGQPNATDGLSTSSSSGVVGQATAVVLQSQKTYATSDYGTVYEDSFYTFSDTSGPVGFYISHLGNETAFEFSQASSPSGPFTVTQSSASAASITTSDANSLGLWQLNDGILYYIDGGGGSWHRYGASPYGGYVFDQYKVNFTYSPANGKYVRVRIIKANKHGKRGTPGAYEYKMYYPADAIVNSVTTSTTKLQNYNYEGLIQYLGSLYPIFTGRYAYGSSPYYVNLSNPAIYKNTNLVFNLADQKVKVTVSGLRPGTTHTVRFNNVDMSSSIKPEGGLLGAPIITNSNGNAVFDIYYGSATPTSAVEKAALNVLMTATNKNLTITSSDGLSSGTTNLEIPAYVNEAINNRIGPVGRLSLQKFDQR